MFVQVFNPLSSASWWFSLQQLRVLWVCWKCLLYCLLSAECISSIGHITKLVYSCVSRSPSQRVCHQRAAQLPIFITVSTNAVPTPTRSCKQLLHPQLFLQISVSITNCPCNHLSIVVPASLPLLK